MINQKIQPVRKLTLPANKKAFFASDFHLGLSPYEKSFQREKIIIQWLEEIKAEAGALFLCGDIFDYWYEYKKVAARGFVRFLAKLCEFTDEGIPVYFFTGNHDVWVFDYLPKEIGVKVFYNPIEIQINDRTFVIGHGDGIGPGDNGYKILRWMFHNKFLQFWFSMLHPNLTYGLGHAWSKHSRYSKGITDSFHGVDKEFNILFANDYLVRKPVDYFVFGHRHVPMDIAINEKSRLFNTGEWISACTYVVFNGDTMELQSFRDKKEWDSLGIVRIT